LASLALWAKKSAVGEGTLYHSLAYHMLDTAAVAEAIIRAFGNSYTSACLGPECIAYLAALHDIGKATPAFQGLDEPRRILLEGEGLSFQGASYKHRHDVLTGAIIAGELGEQLGLPERKQRVRTSLVLGGHHGLYPVIDYSQLSSSEIGTGDWAKARAELVEDVAGAIGGSWSLSAFGGLDLPTSVELTGMVSIADWIASNERFFPYHDNNTPLDEYWGVARRLADSALASLNWELPADSGLKSFPDLFGFDPRPLQEAVVSLGEALGDQALVIIEAPTGEGKTEAALYLASVLAERGQRGCYLALPTQPTSNQMFGRVAEYLSIRRAATSA
jgi:CRISPR-associated endonuclease/helicase Cas3